MEEDFDIKLALRVFANIQSFGDKRDDTYYYQGLTGWSDLDGYTVEISDGEVKLSIYFHNQYEFKYDNGKLLDVFIHKLKAVDDIKHGQS